MFFVGWRQCWVDGVSCHSRLLVVVGQLPHPVGLGCQGSVVHTCPGGKDRSYQSSKVSVFFNLAIVTPQVVKFGKFVGSPPRQILRLVLVFRSTSSGQPVVQSRYCRLERRPNHNSNNLF